MKQQRYNDLRERAAQPAAILFGIIVVLVILMAIDAPPAYDARDRLRKLYQPERVTIVSEKSRNLVQSCGTYRIGGNRTAWKFLDTDDGFWAGERSREWRSPSTSPAAFVDLESRWSACMNYRGRGTALGGVTSPLLVTFLNAT